MTCPRSNRMICLALAVVVAAGCDGGNAITAGRHIETGFAFTNFSTDRYAALRIREHTSAGLEAFFDTPLLAPGATQRTRFLDALGVACPEAIDFRVLLYERVSNDVPIGLDPGEEVESRPAVAGVLENLPVCGTQPVETLTIVNWDAPEGVGIVKIAQGTPLEGLFAERGLFPNADGAWTFEGVAEELADSAPPPPPHAEVVEIRGRVVNAAGTGVADIGVLVRTRFRVRLNDSNAANDPDAGFGDPIAFVTTNQSGAFSFARPAGVYRVEFFSDDFLFRPVALDVESPSGELISVVEPR